MSSRRGVLFLLENDYYPRDARVYNECTALSDDYRCFVLAPRGKGEEFIETVGSTTCFRYPHFEADSFRFILLEYAIAAIWIALLTPPIVVFGRVSFLHVANPPDILIPLTALVRLFGTRIIFDVHDLSVETFKGKSVSRSALGRLVTRLLRSCELWSIRLSSMVITTNDSIRDHVRGRSADKYLCVVRNSNSVQFASLEAVQKRPADGVIRLGYFGVLAQDDAAGLDNLIAIATALQERRVRYKLSIVGAGPGLHYVRQQVSTRGLEPFFEFHGFVPVPRAFDLIKHFDFGVVSWGYLQKNHLHTAMKVMDYMCCAVPVCSLNLKEQLISTNGIGIHADNFEDIVDKMLAAFSDPAGYEALRKRTLNRFNLDLSWETQKQTLLQAYARLSHGESS